MKWYMDRSSLFFLLMVVPVPYLKKCSLLLNCLWIFVKNLLIAYVWVCLWTVHYVPLICLSIFYQHHPLLLTLLSYKSWGQVVTLFFFSPKVSWLLQVPCASMCILESVCQFIQESFPWISIQIALNL
jgi:hypothetical protein